MNAGYVTIYALCGFLTYGFIITHPEWTEHPDCSPCVSFQAGEGALFWPIWWAGTASVGMFRIAEE